MHVSLSLDRANTSVAATCSRNGIYLIIIIIIDGIYVAL